MSHPVGAAFSLAVGIISFGLAVLAYAAYRRNHHRNMLFVLGAFGLFAIKGIMVFVEFQTGFPGHNAMEIIGSAMDLGVVLLLVAPFVFR